MYQNNQAFNYLSNLLHSNDDICMLYQFVYYLTKQLCINKSAILQAFNLTVALHNYWLFNVCNCMAERK